MNRDIKCNNLIKICIYIYTLYTYIILYLSQLIQNIILMNIMALHVLYIILDIM